MFSMDVKIKTRAWVSLQHRRGKPTQESMFWLVTMKSHEEYVLSLLGACESCAECTLEGFICKLEENYIYLLSTSSHLSGLTQQEITFLAHSGRACCEVSRLLEVPTLEPADEVRCCPVLHPWRRLLQKRLIEKKWAEKHESGHKQNFIHYLKVTLNVTTVLGKLLIYNIKI